MIKTSQGIILNIGVLMEQLSKTLRFSDII